MSDAAPSSIAFRDFRSATGAWWLAVRPRTLGASVFPVVVGIAFASRETHIDLVVAMMTAATALLLQVAANLANDYFDFAAGIDTERRLGPARAAASGLLAPQSVKRGAFAALAGALLLGIILVGHGGLPILSIGVAAAGCALAYSAGPAPLASHGLGEILAFVFFGVAAVAGSALLQGAAFAPSMIAVAIPVAALVTAVMVVNNLRDIPTDAETGKRTLAVRLGERGTRLLYTGLVGAAFAALPVLAYAITPTALLPAILLPLGLGEVRNLGKRHGAELNRSLGGTARLHALFAGTLALGLLR